MSSNNETNEVTIVIYATDGQPVLSMAVNDSDQVRDLVSGQVKTVGAHLIAMTHEVEEIFYRSTRDRPWDIAEMSMGKYVSLVGRGDSPFVALPVFLSRSFRHSGIFVRHDGPVDAPERLKGARIGIPEWTVTATVYQRALLQHEYGLSLSEISWVQGGTNAPGRIETLPVNVSTDISIRAERERSLSQLMLDGDLDAILVPHPPAAFVDGSGRIVQLFSDPQMVERAYFEKTGVFPIMHLVIIRRDVHEQLPWLAGNLLTAFTEAKDRSVARLHNYTAARVPMPWSVEHSRKVTDLFGGDPWPYGLEGNLRTLEHFCSYAAEQGLTQRLVDPSELFPESVLSRFIV
jgi:4,5-dihydroxyphthalate decarboxylase